MSKNPVVNALSASAYIILVVTVMTFVTQPFKNMERYHSPGPQRMDLLGIQGNLPSLILSNF